MNEEEKSAFEEPLFNIGVVTRVTGLPIATLHAWERRYDFPHSARTAGGHRLYSEKDIARLRWVKTQVDSGLQTRQAIQAVQRLENQGRLPIGTVQEPSQAAAEQPLPPLGREHLLEALLHHDLEGADRIMGEMLAFYTPEDMSLQVIGPTLADIGEAWASGQITVADEHLATGYLRHRLLMWMVTGPRPYAITPTVLVCAPGEWHEGSLLMLGVLLRRQGWPVAYLGQSVPLSDLGAFTQVIHPPAIVLVAMSAETAQALAAWPKYLAQAAGKPLVGFGGRVFVNNPDLQRSLPGTYLGSTLQEGLSQLTGFLKTQLQ
ncbi:MAG: MerR family transcriptional regulator [Anaerolineales bacterium]|jgi:DNA-binding transcriptional MerR regulator